ncbi:hypothetical protein WKY82_00345 [Gordonia malaquae]|uniref:hypothetical protein n=1 Tax=Gordonia malaquae TaxID=410332 RepID=UPI0030C79666
MVFQIHGLSPNAACSKTAGHLSVDWIDRMDDEVARVYDAYGRSVDPAEIVNWVRRDDRSAWAWIWENLLHQGTVGSAAYAVAIELINLYAVRPRRWEIYSFVCHLELWRSPEETVPLRWSSVFNRVAAFALEDYPSATDDSLMIEPILGVLALDRGLTTVGWFCAEMTDDERSEALDNVATPLPTSASEIMRVNESINYLVAEDSNLRPRERRTLKSASEILAKYHSIA